jgi:non-heme chloroperoxidase
MSPMTEREDQQIEQANGSSRPPVVFIHGLWLLPSSWDRWAQVFEEAGYAALTPSWPHDPETVADARAHPEVLAGTTVGQVVEHIADVIGRVSQKAAIIGRGS